jgi:hypothetical protein
MEKFIRGVVDIDEQFIAGETPEKTFFPSVVDTGQK